jgi:hypothetical protein
VLVKLRRKELGQPHGTGPGAAQVRELDVPVLKHFQGEEKLFAELILAAAKIGLGREHA